MIRFHALFALFLALFLTLGLLWACGGDDDDDNDDAASGDDDDNSPDDDASPADDDDDDDNDDDDETPTGPAPLIDTLTMTPNDGFAGDTIALSFHFQDLEGDVDGGTITLLANGDVMTTFAAHTAGTTEGFIDSSYLIPAELPTGTITIGITLTDLANNTSNLIEATFHNEGENTAPVISNLHFDPDPACNAANSAFTIIFDYHDAEANLDGALVNLIIDNQFPPLTLTLTGSGPPDGTLPITLTLSDTFPDNQPLNIKVQMTDNRYLISNLLDGDLTLSSSACK
ncbi:MAG: hypothetical protein GX444_06720 [Myxococcales bacterium]|nr:hypothetical protein [Myxococcales bacterium]